MYYIIIIISIIPLSYSLQRLGAMEFSNQLFIFYFLGLGVELRYANFVEVFPRKEMFFFF